MRGGHATLCPWTGDQAQADGEQAVAAERIACQCLARAGAGGAQQHIRKPAIGLPPEIFPYKRSLGFQGQLVPLGACASLINPPHQPQQSNPEDLYFHRVTFPRRAGGIVRCPFGEMAGTPNETGVLITPDPVGRAVVVVLGNAHQDLANGPSVAEPFVKEVVVAQFFTSDGKPQWGVAGFPVGNTF